MKLGTQVKNILGRVLGRLVRTGEPMRGRVNRVNIISSGELSVVVRFGMDEPRAHELKPGTMIELVPTTAKRLKGEVAIVSTGQCLLGPQTHQIMIEEHGMCPGCAPPAKPAVIADPLADVRWICPKCSTVNGIEDPMCCACDFDRPPP